MPKIIKSMADLTPDVENANKGTQRGQAVLARSLEEYGAGRSIVADRDGRVIAGNKTLETAAAMDLPVTVVQSDGTSLIVVQRTDLSLDESAGRGLAYADNRAGELGLEWDIMQIERDRANGSLPDNLFAEYEMAALRQQAGMTPAAAFNPEDHWTGMPEFHQDDLTPFAQCFVNFRNAEDMQAFEELLGQRIPRNTRSLWYPYEPKGNAKEFGYDGPADE